MKRFLAQVLSIVIIFSLVACGKEGKAEKYCSNCGGGISKSASFCEYCGTAIDIIQDANSDNLVNNTSSGDASSYNISSTESSENSSSDVKDTETTCNPAE